MDEIKSALPGQDGPVASGEERGSFDPGGLIAERYVVVRFLARGGFGEVYEVQDRELDERVALKVLQATLARDDDQRERFRREIQLARRVTHPNVCRIFDAGLHDSINGSALLYLTMELLSGVSLSRRIAELGRLTSGQALPLVRQMAAALEAAHRLGIVHRDFKSGNVILEPSGGPDGGERAVVTDFGLARAVGSSSPGAFETALSSGLTGTAAYMAPEQVEDGEVSAATDVYALGIVLFEMLTGRVPFQGKSAMATAVQRLRRDAPSPRSIAPTLDRVWEAVILRCLERRPEDRYASARDVVQALTGEISAGATRRLRRRRRVVAVISVVVGLGAAMGFATWWWSTPELVLRFATDPVQLTADPGLEIDPALSPDGSAVAYTTDRDGQLDLYLKQLTPGGRELRVTLDCGQCFQPSFSPDGTTLAYASRQRGGLWLVPTIGGAPRRLTEVGSSPAWSPDGRWIAFQEDGRNEIAERSVPALPPSTVWVVEASGGEPRQLTRVGEPSGGHGEPEWSPQGKRIYFSAGDRRGSSIWSIDAAGGDLERTVDQARVQINPVLSSDGETLYYIGVSAHGREAGGYAVWAIGVDAEQGDPSGEPHLVSYLGASTIRQLSLSKSGDRMVYSALTSHSHLWELPISEDGRVLGMPSPLTSGNSRNSRPAFSPDGSRVAFDRWQVGTNLDIYLLEVDRTGDPVAVTVDPQWDSQASWLPGGRQIAYFSERRGRRGLWVSDLDTGEQRFFADIGADADWARVSPDGRRVAFHSRQGGLTINVFVLDLDSGGVSQLTRDAELAAFPSWSPDGRSLAYEVRRAEDTHVMVLSLDGGAPRQLTDERGESWPYGWSPDGEKVTYAALRGGLWSLRWVSLRSGESAQLLEEQSLDAYVRYPAWSPRGDRLVYERTTTVADLWLLELGRQ